MNCPICHKKCGLCQVCHKKPIYCPGSLWCTKGCRHLANNGTNNTLHPQYQQYTLYPQPQILQVQPLVQYGFQTQTSGFKHPKAVPKPYTSAPKIKSSAHNVQGQRIKTNKIRSQNKPKLCRVCKSGATYNPTTKSFYPGCCPAHSRIAISQGYTTPL